MSAPSPSSSSLSEKSSETTPLLTSSSRSRSPHHRRRTGSRPRSLVSAAIHHSSPAITTNNRYSALPTHEADASRVDLPSSRHGHGHSNSEVRRWAVRALALVCATSLSVGAHYGREFLGPIKSRLAREIGSTNVEFSIILASYSVNNTWTPLVAGLLASRLGTARTSLLATSLILVGQIVLLIGRSMKSVGVMAAGLFAFGLGISPISVVQETIIVRFFSRANLGTFLSLGLLFGKSASFFSALTSFPLSEINPLYPFVAATCLAAFSWVVNVGYWVGGAWLARGAGVEMEEAEVRLESVRRRREKERERERALMARRGVGVKGSGGGGGEEEEEPLTTSNVEREATSDSESTTSSSGSSSSSGSDTSIGTSNPPTPRPSSPPSHPHLHDSQRDRQRDRTTQNTTSTTNSTIGASQLQSQLQAQLQSQAQAQLQSQLQAQAQAQAQDPTMLSQHEAEAVVARKKHVILHDIVKLGDVFWVFLLLNYVCGSIWSPFTHIAANLFSVRYGYSEARAGWVASFLHAGSMVLYPICGYITDHSKQKYIVYKLALLSSMLTLGCYFWLLLPAGWTTSALPGVVMFGLGQGFGTLLLVIMVPRIVPPKYVPTALGAHKSVESAGSTISVTIAGLILDKNILKKSKGSTARAVRFFASALTSSASARSGSGSGSSMGLSSTSATDAIELASGLSSSGEHQNAGNQGAVWTILFGFFIGNVLQMCCVLWLWRLDRRRRARAAAMLLRSEVQTRPSGLGPGLDRRYTAPGVVEAQQSREDEEEENRRHGGTATLSPNANEVVVFASSSSESGSESEDEDDVDVEAGAGVGVGAVAGGPNVWKDHLPTSRPLNEPSTSTSSDATLVAPPSAGRAGRYRTLSMHSDTPLIPEEDRRRSSLGRRERDEYVHAHANTLPRSAGRHGNSHGHSHHHHHESEHLEHAHTHHHAHERRSRRHSRRHSHSHHSHHPPTTPTSTLIVDGLALPAPSRSSIRRGKLFFALCGLVIFGAWTFYVSTLVRDLSRRAREEGSGGGGH